MTSRLAQDSRFEAFRVDDFDAAQFTSRALSDALASAQTTGHHLREDIKQLENGIREEVLQKQAVLHNVVTSLGEMEDSCVSVDGSVGQLGKAVGVLQSSLEAPCQRLRIRTTQLKNLRTAVEMMRAVSRRLKGIEKLKKRIGDDEGSLEGVDLPDVARIITDLHTSVAEVDVSGIHVLEEDTNFVESVTVNVRSRAEQKLMKGQESLNQADMGTALHVFFNLNELPAAVEMLAAKKVAKLSQKARNTFDFHKLMTGGKTSGQQSLQESVWTSVKTLVTELEDDAVGIFHLQQVLAKKTDPITHIPFLSVVGKGNELLDQFWMQAVGLLERSISHAVQPGKSTPVREVLVHGFPRLCAMHEAAVERLSQRCGVKGKVSCFGPQHLQSLLGSCSPVQTVFAARSLTHMSDAVEGAFPSGSRAIPPSTEIQKLVSVFHEEMKQAENSVHTCRLVANNIANAALSIAEKVELLAATGVELRSLSGSCNPSQSRNISLCSSLQEIHKSLIALIVKLDEKGVEFLVPACDTLRATAQELITPIFKSFAESLEQLVIGIHNLASWKTERQGTSSVVEHSVYVNALRNQLRTFSMEFLTRFTPPFSPSSPSFVRSLVKRLSCRLIVFFIRHAALIRPLSASGRQQLITDTTELENVLSQTLLPVSSLQHHLTTLHAFQELLQIEPSQIRGHSTILQLPRSVILHHLFSRIPQQVKLPHERIGLTPSQFSFWLDSHSVEQAVDGVRSVLESQRPFSEDGAPTIAILLDLCKA